MRQVSAGAEVTLSSFTAKFIADTHAYLTWSNMKALGRPVAGPCILFLRPRVVAALGAWRNNVLHPQVDCQIAVVFHSVHVVDSQHEEFRHVESAELHYLGSGCVGHAVVSLVAVGEGIL